MAIRRYLFKVCLRSRKFTLSLLDARRFSFWRYTIKIAVDNQNEIVDVENNASVKLLSIDRNGTWQVAESTLEHGYQVKEYTFTLTEEFNMIGFQVARVGPGDDLDISVSELKIVSYKK